MSETEAPVEEMEVIEENGGFIKDGDELQGESSESEEISPDLPEIEIEPCRLCDDVSEKMFNIFEDNPEGYQLIGLIKENLPIVLYKTDPLSKLVCEKCVLNLQIISSLKKRSRKTQDKYVEKLKTEGDTTDKNILLFLGCAGSKLIENGDEEEEEEEELKDQATSTDDLTILCSNCKTSILDASTVNGEVELSTDLHEILRESLKKNRVLTGDEISQFDDMDIQSDIESNESNEEHPAKRRKIDRSSKEIQDEINQELAKRKTENGTEESSEKDKDSEHTFDESDVELNERLEEERKAEQERIAQITVKCAEMFKEEPEFIFEPLSLVELLVNLLNEQNVPDYETVHYKQLSVKCICKTCNQEFKNYKLLALHEQAHMEVDIDERIDQPNPWPNEHPFAKIRNKWLTNFDEIGYDDDEEGVLVHDSSVVRVEEDATLLVEDTGKTMDASKNDEVILVDMKPMVNGIYLGDYTKEERKAFYQCMRIGGQTKRFCSLCRYCFKDNWAIESHYFSFACFYTCRYCGMRFNKQRHRFEEHVQDHKKHAHSMSDKIYTASKVNNTLPKIIQPDKVKRIIPGEPEKPREIRLEDYSSPPVIMKGGFDQRNKQTNPGQLAPQAPSVQPIKVKEEPKDPVSSQNKTQNQAYFCRKCYKVFFKLDEFNAHSKNCDYNSYTPGFGPTVKPGISPMSSKPSPPVKIKQEPGIEPKINGDTSIAGRPVRNCARDIGPYKDEVYIPKQILNETLPGPPQSFICHICGTPFPTIYSRNSHMRIHKGEGQGGPSNGGPSPQMIMQQNILKQRLQQQQQHSFQMQKAAMQQQQMQQKQMLRQKQIQQRVQQQQLQNYNQYEEIRVKEEPVDSFEPMVEIHEGHERSPSPPTLPREIGGGAVSLTPIVKKPALNPNILKLVENNPNISLVTKRPSSSPVQRSHGGNIIKNAGGYQGPYAPVNQQNGTSANYITVAPNLVPNDDKSYKCSSCWEAFSNKSHLYFHKKNQCEGSRFPCPFCKKRFGTEAAYSSHIFYSHPE